MAVVHDTTETLFPVLMTGGGIEQEILPRLLSAVAGAADQRPPPMISRPSNLSRGR